MNSDPTPFSVAWTAQDTKAWLEDYHTPGDAAPINQGGIDKKSLARACGQHVAWLIQQGADIWPEHCEHLKTPFMMALRRLRENPEDAVAQDDVGQRLERQLDMMFLYGARNDTSTPGEIHEAMQAKMVQGDFPNTLSDPQLCFSSGEHVQVRAMGWKFQAGRMAASDDPNSWRRVFTPLQEGDIAPPQTHTAIIPVPSGQLLIADWFRIDAFNALTKPLDDEDSADGLSSTAGRAAVSLRYAQRLGVVHVFGRAPSIVCEEGAVKVGHLDPDEKTPAHYVGQIMADLRWTTIVDRAHLVSLLAGELGAEAAQAEVDALAQDPDVLTVQVNPGTHHLYFAGDAHTFQATAGEQFMVDGLDLDTFEEPVFVLTEQALAPAIKVRRQPGL